MLKGWYRFCNDKFKNGDKNHKKTQKQSWISNNFFFFNQDSYRYSNIIVIMNGSGYDHASWSGIVTAQYQGITLNSEIPIMVFNANKKYRCTRLSYKEIQRCCIAMMHCITPHAACHTTGDIGKLSWERSQSWAVKTILQDYLDK